MISENEIKKYVAKILKDLAENGQAGPAGQAGQGAAAAKSAAQPAVDDGAILPDILEEDLSERIDVPNPHNLEALKAIKKITPARIGVGRAGHRYLTHTLLRFRADHAVAMDAVFTDVPDEWMAEHNLPKFQTVCENKDVFLTRPDLGRRFGPEEAAKIKALVGSNNKVVVFVADGLSTKAVTVNAIDTLKAMTDGLKSFGIPLSAPFFVKYGRVGSEDAVSEITGAEVVVCLIGERPGLVTSESMSAYICYKAYPNIPEAKRTVISNIHRGGTPAVEAGSYIADLVKLMLEKKASGLDLKL
ncbi:MAG: ethanolamine ammonia-lyase subunit EutC [Deltaproteobacteria bacterium]|jgi:ethanolamine ammonia-lyase small subunit|nr:ethanolamine ammonia-lyase subunit EutC [Deltaproteobacteria bacterium]